MALSVQPAQRWPETMPGKRPLGLEITATGDLGKNSLCRVAEGETALRWVGE